MTDTAAESLHDLVATSQERIKELRRAGDPAVLLTAANAAADEIEQRVGERLNDAERQALTAVSTRSQSGLPRVPLKMGPRG
jgi:hypothetical protein